MKLLSHFVFYSICIQLSEKWILSIKTKSQVLGIQKCSLQFGLYSFFFLTFRMITSALWRPTPLVCAVGFIYYCTPHCALEMGDVHSCLWWSFIVFRGSEKRF